jgi:hypothetical protein
LVGTHRGQRGDLLIEVGSCGLTHDVGNVTQLKAGDQAVQGVVLALRVDQRSREVDAHLPDDASRSAGTTAVAEAAFGRVPLSHPDVQTADPYLPRAVGSMSPKDVVYLVHEVQRELVKVFSPVR